MWLAYHRGGADNEAAHVAHDLKETRDVLADFEAAAKDMNGLAGEFTGISSALSVQISTISRNFRNVTKASPLPPDCKPDAFRVQSLDAAIAAANTAAGRFSGPAVPAHP